MALDVGVHDRFEVLELAVLEQVNDVNLGKRKVTVTNARPPFY